MIDARTMRGYAWVHTYQLAQPFNINLSKSESARLETEQLGLLAAGADAGTKAGQPG